MEFRFLSIFTVLLSLNIFGEQKPHAYIVKWAPTHRGGGNFGRMRNKKTLPTYVTIGFDCPIEPIKIDPYLKFLSNRSFGLRVIGTTKQPGQFMITTLSSREEIESILVHANKHFDPQFKTSTELAIEKRKQKEKEDAIKRLEDEKQAEIIRLQNQQREKIEKERKTKLEAERQIKLEAELLAKKRESDEKERLKNEQRKKQKIDAFYSVTPAPKNFFMQEAKGVLNNHGLVAGYFFEDPLRYGAIWNSLTNEIIRLQFNGIAIAINDSKHVIVGHSGGTALLNLNNNQVIFGPAGMPEGLSNSNIVWIRNGCNSSLIWNAKSNSIATADLFGANYRCMNNNGQCYMQYLPGVLANTMNIKGYSNNLKVLCSKETNLFLHSNNNFFSLASPEGTIDSTSAHINDRDEVVAIATTIRDKKTVHKIIKWFNDTKAVVSDPLNNYEEFEPFNIFSIVAFNDVGSILLSARVSQFSKESYFLLAPRK